MAAQAMEDPLLLMSEVSEITRIPIDTLQYLRHRGEGPPSFRLGRRVVSRRSAVLQWIAEPSRLRAAPPPDMTSTASAQAR